MIADLNVFLTKVIPDTRLTIQKYADAKFEYLVRYRGDRIIVDNYWNFSRIV